MLPISLCPYSSYSCFLADGCYTRCGLRATVGGVKTAHTTMDFLGLQLKESPASVYFGFVELRRRHIK